MKKLLCYFVLLNGLFLGCTRDSRYLQIPPQGAQRLDAPDLLRGFGVVGAEKVTYDSAHNAYMVIFPQSFNAEEAEIKLFLRQKVKLLDQAGNTTNNTTIRYRFQGNSPMNLSLKDTSNSNFCFDEIYFNFSGTPKIELLQKEIDVNASGIQLPFRLDFKQGSNPAAPGYDGNKIKITNKKTRISEETLFYKEDPRIYLANTTEFITSDPLSIEFSVYNQNSVVFEDIRFNRATPIAGVAATMLFQYIRQDTIVAHGGFFSPAEKYSVSISGVSLAAPITVPVRMTDASTLKLDKIPANLPDGSYLLSYYEKDKPIGKGAVNISKSVTNVLESIWKGDLNKSLDRNVEQLKLKRGDFFYAKSAPLMFIYPQAAFNVDHLPKLRLKSAGKTAELAPELAEYSWAIAGARFAVGKYTIPADLPSGAYIVTGLYPNKTESKPYWSSIEVE
ncbi:hypothetical protein [Dyadobacter sp. CY326]|uniref:hypothetical protein n=1 Tax=Dyadobacter sp. CY326 TaxID=2907300 RepID=UPI001F21D130|nr:hypothetical protein [Dyadobacter sp. CY326]MCE7066951.1 hypothetical protein [Dyadobacter sp. CY326]